MWIQILADRVRALLRRDDVLKDIDEELRAHIEMETEANRELGMTPGARRSAMKSFGNVGSIKDLAYEVRGGGLMESSLARPALQRADAPEVSGLHRDRGAHARVRHRREHGDLQHRQRGSPATISLRRARATCSTGREQQRDARRHLVVVSQLRRLERQSHRLHRTRPPFVRTRISISPDRAIRNA